MQVIVWKLVAKVDEFHFVRLNLVEALSVAASTWGDVDHVAFVEIWWIVEMLWVLDCGIRLS